MEWSILIMWNLFSRRSGFSGGLFGGATGTATAARSAVAQQDDHPRERTIRTQIAEVERIGLTAVATLTVTELTQERGVEMLADLLDELAESGAQHFVLDIQNVQFMDSACLGCLVQALNRLAVSGGRIALANTPNSVQYLFRMTQLDRVFPICTDVMAALTAVERPLNRRS